MKLDQVYKTCTKLKLCNWHLTYKLQMLTFIYEVKQLLMLDLISILNIQDICNDNKLTEQKLFYHVYSCNCTVSAV